MNAQLDSMSDMIYISDMGSDDKPLVWIHGEVKTPPFGGEARLQAGYLLRALQIWDRGGAGNAALPTYALDRFQMSRATDQ